MAGLEHHLQNRIFRIGVIGPESTGKSKLSGALALHYHTCWVQEYARVYLEKNGPGYTQEDLERITSGQLKAEQKALAKANQLMICDTTVLVIKIWSLHSYSIIGPQLEEALNQYSFDFHLLTNTDIPWEHDPLREHPNLRDFFMSWYRKEALLCKVPYVEIKGADFNGRLEQSIEAIDTYLLSQDKLAN
jgi:NadR type nicotinamide-nucleotide adenylyltransferase